MRGHIPGSRPLVLGSPPPGADAAAVTALAKEVALRLRRHGITGPERLVLVDRGDGVGAMPAAQMAELAGHPQRRDSARRHRRRGRASSRRARSSSSPCVRRRSSRTRARCRRGRRSRRGSAIPSLVLLDVRREEEYTGRPAARAIRGRVTSPARSGSGRRALRGAGPVRLAGADPRGSSARRKGRGRRVLPLRLALRARDARAALAPVTTRATTPAHGTSGAATRAPARSLADPVLRREDARSAECPRLRASAVAPF